MNKTKTGSVHEYVRSLNAEQIEQHMIYEKFKEAAEFIDLEARKQFKYKTTSILECSYGLEKIFQ